MENCQHLEAFREVYQYSQVGIAVIGSLLNIVCLPVLFHRKLDINVFNRIRMLLTFFDLGYLATHAFSTIISWTVSDEAWFQIWEKVTGVIFHIVFVCAIGSWFATVALAVERCYGIKFPLKCRNYNSNVSTRRRAFAIYFIPVVFLIVFNILAKNVFFKPTEPYQPSHLYDTVELVEIILMVVTLTSTNFYVICLFRNQSAIVYQMILISFSSIAAMVSTLTFRLTEKYGQETDLFCESEVLRMVSDLLILSNSSFNIFIYSFIGVQFRTALKETYFCSTSNRKNVATSENVTAETALSHEEDPNENKVGDQDGKC